MKVKLIEAQYRNCSDRYSYHNSKVNDIVIKNQHFIEYFRLLQTSSECEMHLSAKCTIYTILYNTKSQCAIYTILYNTKVNELHI